MDIQDKDLQSIQEVRILVKKAKKAQKEFANFSTQLIDEIVKQLSIAAMAEAENLGKLAVEETGFGIWQDKMTKNIVASQKLYEHIKDMKTIGIISEDKDRKIVEIGTPVGVIAALIPSTNPTSTVIYKTLIALKSGNAIIFSPHPSALKCILKTVKVLKEAAVRMGAPEGLISCISIPTMEGTNELMKHEDVSMILATGGTAMVKAAYSSGTPALGVGPGNVPAYIERSADVKKAVSKILASKTFDNGTVCASEQAIVTEKCISDYVKNELRKQGGYFLTGEEIDKVVRIMETPNGGMNPRIVGKSAKDIAAMAGITIPEGTKVLICEEKGVGKEYPFSKEKLTQLLAFYTVEDWTEGCELCYKLLENGGMGHTLAIHSNNEEVIRQFALKKPVSRLLVNTPSTQGAIGLSTGLTPALTLGCGAVGGSATSDNVGPEHLINIRRMAYEVDDLGITPKENKIIDKLDIDAICKMVIEELKNVKK
ncbi:acetaldehyde dehydrogenase (acetylating) [Paramaledivibacter caminithermalis]|uniref:Acetaldehyde dehydrogenase n=1 Tax=Paramaledivibacter caminithermalis (strain DSM 15212 / CIP 107654 / DViRD3) TaxID=1121301 RepID=A0A1M6PNQ0_PARC5|nr:acetaldehyde dehydrogenase (acetylating) [Paramaledivibacter caminithermalis]SHK09572.1 acetaldehyde dehydrogenase [Paramaledivibacter caminithermalis DSM 15212]